MQMKLKTGFPVFNFAICKIKSKHHEKGFNCNR